VAASKPTFQLSLYVCFFVFFFFRVLSWWSEFFFFRLWTLAPRVCLITLKTFFAFRVWIDYPIKNCRLLLLALQHKKTVITVPKYVSQKTSYIPVWLAFHPLAQIFPFCCNRNEFGLLRICGPSKTFPCQDHKVSGLKSETIVLLELAVAALQIFKLASPFNSLVHDTKGTVLSVNDFTCFVNFQFQGLFHSLCFEFFSQFPHGTISLSMFLPVSCWRKFSNSVTDHRYPSSFLSFYSILQVINFFGFWMP